MKYLIAVLLVSASIGAEVFNKGSASVDVYPVWAHICTFGSDQVTYTTYDNQTEGKYSQACALTYDYRRCLTGEIKDAFSCIKSRWKSKTLKKLLFLSNKDRESCPREAQKLAHKLVEKKFKCIETGIN